MSQTLQCEQPVLLGVNSLAHKVVCVRSSLVFKRYTGRLRAVFQHESPWSALWYGWVLHPRRTLGSRLKCGRQRVSAAPFVQGIIDGQLLKLIL